ncbi:MAG: hypothetical protein Q9181_005218 [Wetmoreana brouardii]
MGRLNYTNRKTDGLKLGQIIAKDLTKRIPPGTASKSAFRDPVVELDVTGRALGQDGFQEMADALIKSLQYNGEQGKVLLLEELCLKTNGLNAACLPALAQIIRLAAAELRDLDLSDNCFLINSIQEADAWEDFLEAFADCCTLRRIDLSGNAIGQKAFEVLARVYSREPSMELLLDDDLETTLHSGPSSRRGTLGGTDTLQRHTGNLSLGSASEASADEGQTSAAVDHKVEHGIRHGWSTPTFVRGQFGVSDLAHIYTATRGLRSIPYMIFSNIGLNDAERLLRHVPSTKASHHIQQMDYYDNKTGCQGIVYLPNSEISSPGIKMLELSENVRVSLLNDDQPPPSPEYPRAHSRKTSTARKPSATHASPYTTASGPRRRSGTRGELEELTECEAVKVELDRARSRIQGETLKEAGVQSHDLWWSSLQMLVFCRTLCPLRQGNEPQASPKPQQVEPGAAEPAHDPDFPTLPKSRKPFVGYLDPFSPPLTAENTNAPVTPKSKKPLPKLKTATPSPLSLATTSPTSASPKTGMQQPNHYRSDLLFGFSEAAWARIIAYHVSAHRYMSERQQCSVLKWAVDRRTLAREMESLGKPESVQIWKVLEGMGCLAYESDA